MNQTPIATVVIPTYHRPELLALCLESIARVRAEVVGGAVEVIVSDDSRDTRSRDLVAAQFPWVTYIEGPRRGPAANRNCGARLARGTWLIFTDDDCLAEPGWLAAYLTGFARRDGTQLFEGRTRADRPRRTNLEESPLNENGGYLWSCNMALTRQLFWQLQGFCESFPHPALEDVDMRLRLAAAGHSPVFVPAATICHPYRPRKGIDFIRQHNESYVHLLERHPDIWHSFTWRGIVVEAMRLCLAVARNAIHYGLGGSGRSLYAAATKIVIDARFKRSRRGINGTALT